jgi:hypothetical protein
MHADFDLQSIFPLIMLLLYTYDHFAMQQRFLLNRRFYYCGPFLFHLIFCYASVTFVCDFFQLSISSVESTTHMSDQTNCNEVEAEECDAYEENQEEPVAMVEESPPDVGQDGLYNHNLHP